MKIFIVMGTTGEYSDRAEWPVVAFHSELLAQVRVTQATTRGNELSVKYPYTYEYNSRKNEKMGGETNEFDPNFRFEYNGTSYYILSVELES